MHILADTVNDTVFSLIKQELRNSGKIERVGSDKTGYWKITE